MKRGGQRQREVFNVVCTCCYQHRRPAPVLLDQSPIPVMPSRGQVLQDPIPSDPHGQLAGFTVQSLHHRGLSRVIVFKHVSPHRQVRELRRVVVQRLLLPAHDNENNQSPGGLSAESERRWSGGSPDTALSYRKSHTLGSIYVYIMDGRTRDAIQTACTFSLLMVAPYLTVYHKVTSFT